MNQRKAMLAGLLLVPVLTPRVVAQMGIPSTASPFAPVPGAAGAAPGAAPTAAAPAAGGGRTIWNFFGITKENCAACRAALCQSQLGSLLNNATKPLGAFTGGIIPSICPPLPPGAAGGPAAGGPGGAQSVASKIAQDTAEAKARVAAVEYLGTVDCHYWPEAEAALIQSLRTDRNECVRFAAARVMGSGCCCTKNTMAALLIVVTGDDKDGNPAETSERVRAAAFNSLQNCQCRYTEPLPSPPERPEPIRPEAPETAASAPSPREARGADGALVLTSYYTKQVRDMPMAELLAQARRVLAQASDIPLGRVALPTGRKDVLDALVRSATRPSVPPQGPVALRRDDAIVPSSNGGGHGGAAPKPSTISPPVSYRHFAPLPAPVPPPVPVPVPPTASRVAPAAGKTTAAPDRLARQAAPPARDHSLLEVLLSSGRPQTEVQ